MTEQRIAEVFVELADTLVDDFDVVDFLQALTERCVEVLDATAAGLVLADERGHLQMVAGTSARTRDLELFELQQDEGPCVDCYSTGQAVLNVVVPAAGQEDGTAAGRRWPAFTRAAAAAGVCTTSALPLRLRGRVIGALNLFSERADVLGEESLAVGQAMADIATIGLINERSLREKTVLSEQLQSALQSRIVVEQAKGVLSARTGTTVAQAFALLRTHARRTRTPLTTVAERVVAGELTLGGVSTVPASGDEAPGPAELSDLDLQVLRMVSVGTAAPVVARRLGITPADVTERLLVVRARLRVDTTAAAVQEARRSGLL